jgi:hypothetical protein
VTGDVKTKAKTLFTDQGELFIILVEYFQLELAEESQR